MENLQPMPQSQPLPQEMPVAASAAGAVVNPPAAVAQPPAAAVAQSLAAVEYAVEYAVAYPPAIAVAKPPEAAIKDPPARIADPPASIADPPAAAVADPPAAAVADPPATAIADPPTAAVADPPAPAVAYLPTAAVTDPPTGPIFVRAAIVVRAASPPAEPLDPQTTSFCSNYEVSYKQSTPLLGSDTIRSNADVSQSSSRAVLPPPKPLFFDFFPFAFQMDEKRHETLKATILKVIICVAIARSWISLVVLIRPVAFGLPIDLGHKLSCSEALTIVWVTVIFASLVLYALSQVQLKAKAGRMDPFVNKVLQGLGASGATMWAGASLSPMATTCVNHIPYGPVVCCRLSIPTPLGPLLQLPPAYSLCSPRGLGIKTCHCTGTMLSSPFTIISTV